jgi:hypothetical protein
LNPWVLQSLQTTKSCRRCFRSSIERLLSPDRRLARAMKHCLHIVSLNRRKHCLHIVSLNRRDSNSVEPLRNHPRLEGIWKERYYDVQKLHPYHIVCLFRHRSTALGYADQ